MNGEAGDVPTMINKIKSTRNTIAGKIQYALFFHIKAHISAKMFFLFIETSFEISYQFYIKSASIEIASASSGNISV